MNEYKVTILGAGLAGCEAALWLAGKGVVVALNRLVRPDVPHHGGL